MVCFRPPPPPRLLCLLRRYPRLLTLDGARAEARRLYDEAVESLAPFGDNAKPLLAIAEYIVERKN